MGNTQETDAIIIEPAAETLSPAEQVAEAVRVWKGKGGIELQRDKAGVKLCLVPKQGDGTPLCFSSETFGEEDTELLAELLTDLGVLEPPA